MNAPVPTQGDGRIGLIATLVDNAARLDPEVEAKALYELFGIRRQRPGRQHASRELSARLLDRVTFGATDCWHWMGVRNTFGYGRMTYEGRSQVAHRLSYRAFVGEIPEGLSVLHRCDNRACINPEHLWLGTYSDNMRDCIAKGRRVKRGQKR
jgi:hypothetical protein